MLLSGETEGCNLRPVARQQLLLRRDENAIPHREDTELAGAEEDGGDDGISDHRPEGWLVESPCLKGAVHQKKRVFYLPPLWSVVGVLSF